MMLICIICAILMIPAMREDKELIDRIFRISKEEGKKESFYQMLKFGIREKIYIESKKNI